MRTFVTHLCLVISTQVTAQLMVNVPDSVLKGNNVYKISHFDMNDSLNYTKLFPLGNYTIFDTSGCEVLTQTYVPNTLQEGEYDILYTHFSNYDNCNPKNLIISKSINSTNIDAIIYNYDIPKRSETQYEKIELENGTFLSYETNESDEGPINVGQFFSYESNGRLDSCLYYDMNNILHDRSTYSYHDNGLLKSSESETIYDDVRHHYSLFLFDEKGLPLEAHIITNTFWKQSDTKYRYIIEYFD